MAPYRRILHRLSLRLHRWVDPRIVRHLGGERRPAFYDPGEVCPELLRIDAHYEEIRAEVLALLSGTTDMPRYHEVDASQRPISAGGEVSWRVLHVFTRGAPDAPNPGLCPRTLEVVRGIPQAISAFFSVLEPRKSVPPHRGPSMANLRYHTAFVVPKKDPPSIRVKDRWYTWKEGESVLFDDTHEHEVANESDGLRVVLIVDVWRPLPLPLRLVRQLAAFLMRCGTSDKEWREILARQRLRPAPAL